MNDNEDYIIKQIIPVTEYKKAVFIDFDDANDVNSTYKLKSHRILSWALLEIYDFKISFDSPINTMIVGCIFINESSELIPIYDNDDFVCYSTSQYRMLEDHEYKYVQNYLNERKKKFEEVNV
jgi:hypothetical protein